MTRKLVELGVIFLWTVARMLVREAAWLTVQAAKERNRARLAYQDPRRPRAHVIDLHPRGGTWSMVQYSFDGPAGYRRSEQLEELKET